MKHYVFFMIIFFFLFKTAISTRNVQVDIIQETCKRSASNDPNVNLTFCLNSFNFIPKAHNSTLKGLGVIATTISKYSATQIRTEIKKTLKSKTLKNDFPYLKSCLETCLELYSDAVLSLKKASTAIKGVRYDDANIMLSSVVDAPMTCEDGFSEGGIESTLKNVNDEFFQHSVIALSIVAILQGLHG